MLLSERIFTGKPALSVGTNLILAFLNFLRLNNDWSEATL
jgi:hypothetical protein